MPQFTITVTLGLLNVKSDDVASAILQLYPDGWQLALSRGINSISRCHTIALYRSLLLLNTRFAEIGLAKTIVVLLNI